jgi:predicted AlkP superfamily phosphohydrolase/phosphomutase
MIREVERIIVIGWDGATYAVIKPLIEQGRLPHLASLIKSGVAVPLKSTIMPNSFPAWVSATTGVNPGRHSIYWSLIRKQDNSYPLQLMSSRDIKARTLWDILGDYGKRAIVINVPPEYPPRKLNGIMVCGALTPGPESDYTYPAELKDEILKVVPDYRCEIDFANINLEELSLNIMRSIENREKLVLYLMKEKPWDLLFAVFTETDLAQHKYWAGIDPDHPDHRRFRRKYGSFIYDVYERLDKALGKALDIIPARTAVFVVSDHGFGPFYQAFSVSQWLMEKKYLYLKKSMPKSLVKKVVKSESWRKKWRLLKRYLAYYSTVKKGSLDVRSLREKDVLSSAQAAQRIDWARSLAYHTSDYGIRLNLKGREPFGKVMPGEEERRIKEAIKEELGRLTYSNGRPVFEAVLTKEEAYSGPFVDRAPDLIIPINHAEAPPAPERWTYVLTDTSLSGTHSPLGVLIACGEGIKKNPRLESPSILDLTPTILGLLEIPFEEDFDGRVLRELFEVSNKYHS